MELWKAIKKHKPACVPLHSFLPPLHLSLEHQNKAVPCKIACYWMSLVPIQGGSINSAMPFMVLIYTPKFPSRGKTLGRHNSWQGGCKPCWKCSPAVMKAARKKWLQVWWLSNRLTEWKKGRWGWELVGKYLEKTIRKRGQALAEDRNNEPLEYIQSQKWDKRPGHLSVSTGVLLNHWKTILCLFPLLQPFLLHQGWMVLILVFPKDWMFGLTTTIFC